MELWPTGCVASVILGTPEEKLMDIREDSKTEHTSRKLYLALMEAMTQSNLWKESEHIAKECSSIICASIVLGEYLGTI